MQTLRQQETTGTGGPTGDWLFKKDDQVFGPVPVKALLGMLYRGEIDGDTIIAPEGGSYQPIGILPQFLVHVKKAEAAVRVEREVTGARKLKQRRSAVRTVAGMVLGIAVLLGAAYGAYWLATVKPWQRRSALLEDFGNGIAVASEAKVGGGHHLDDEVEVAVGGGETETPTHPAARHSRPVGSASSGRTGSTGSAWKDDTRVQYDIGDIKNVVSHQQRTLEPCLRSEARRSPEFSGDIPLEFAIGNDGRVAQLWIDEPRFKHGELRDCMLRTLQTWHFKPFPGQRANVNLSFRIDAR